MEVRSPQGFLKTSAVRDVRGAAGESNDLPRMHAKQDRYQIERQAIETNPAAIMAGAPPRSWQEQQSSGSISSIGILNPPLASRQTSTGLS